MFIKHMKVVTHEAYEAVKTIQVNIVLYWKRDDVTFSSDLWFENGKATWTLYIWRHCLSAGCWAPLIFNLLKHSVIIAMKNTVPCFSLMICLMFIDNKGRLSLCRFQCALCPSHGVCECYFIK